MRLRLFALLLGTVLTGHFAQAQQPVLPPAPNAPGTFVQPDPNELVGPIRAPDADLDTVLGIIKALTRRDILRPAALPNANGPFNLEIQQMSRSDALALILTVLKLNNIGVVEQGDRALVVNQLNLIAREAPEIISGTTLDLTPSGRIATKIFKLNFLSAQQFFGGITASLLSNTLNATPVQLLSANAAIVTDTIANLQKIEKLIQQFDQPSTNVNSKAYTLTSASAAAVVQTLNTSLAQMRAAGQLGVNTTFTADARTNQVIVIASPDVYPFFDSLIKQLDIRADPNTVAEVIFLKHAIAADTNQMLVNLITGQNTAIQRATNGQAVRPGQVANQQGQNQQGQIQNGIIGPGGIAQPAVAAPGAPAVVPAVTNILNAPNVAAAINEAASNNVFSSTITSQPDTRTNSIIVSGTASDVTLIKKILEQIDIVLAQVRIEVVAVEVTLGNQDTSGISALGLNIAGDKLVGFSGTAAGSSVSITNGTVTRPGTNSNYSYDLAADIAIATTPRKTNSVIFTVPAITTTHNKQATVFSGETRPVITGSTTSTTGTTSSVTQQPIGTTLTVTPLIGIDGTVEMNITQEITDVSGTVLIDGNDQPIISTKRTESYVSAKSGDIVVAGGFQKKTDSKSTSRLGPIPIIGDLFGARTRNNTRQEIIFFLRPTILSNNPAADNADTMRKVDQMPQRDEIRKQLDPSYVAPKSSILDRVLPQ